MLLVVLVASEAARAGFLRRCIPERENLCFVASPVDVFLSRTVARFASMPFRAFATLEFAFHRGSDVRRGFELVEGVLMAGLAGVCANVQRGFGGAYVLLPQVGSALGFGGLLLLTCRSCRCAKDQARIHRHESRSS